MSYLILEVPSEGEAINVSREYFRLSRPVGVAKADDVTKLLSGIIIHPDTGEVALFINEESFLIDLLASDENLPVALFNGRVNVPDRAQMKNDIAAQRGARSTMAVLLPAGLEGDIKPDAFMEAQGWFPNPQNP